MKNKIRCIKAHCGVCYTMHPCVNTKTFEDLSSEEKTEALLKDPLIEFRGYSNVIQASDKEMHEFVKVGEKYYSEKEEV